LRGERLKGVEAVAWSSTVTTPDILFYHLLPRLLVVAEAAWHGEDSLPWDKLAPLVEQEMAHLRRSVPYWNPQRP
jgi:beta-L-N-acetylhexosaminidase